MAIKPASSSESPSRSPAMAVVEMGGGGEVYTYRVNGMLPVIIWDAELGKRRIMPMR